MKIFTLNCQKAYQPNFENFIIHILKEEKYDFLLLQEITEQIIVLIKNASQNYKILNSYDSNLGENTGVCILYKKEFVLTDDTFLSFAILNTDSPRRGWGFVGGKFTKDNEVIFISTIHLHPGLRPHKRLKQLEIIKAKILEENLNNPIVIGGDFNTGFPFEITNQEKILSPEFSRINKTLGPTLDSRYTEQTPFFITKIANFFASIGISVKLKTDHIYVNKFITQNLKVNCKLLPDRISDHLAIDVFLIV
ncbi:MAG: endonuclease/exonuclease/phosphatase family protein [Patescibacteria group bacterium]